MPDALYAKFKAIANWKAFLILLIAAGVCVWLFSLRIEAFQEWKALDGYCRNVLANPSCGYSPQDVVDLFNGLDKIGMRNLYGLTEITLDIIFPLIYSLLLVLAIVLLYREKYARYLMFLPLTAGLSDVAENLTVAFMAFSFTGKASPLASVAVIFTWLKWFLSEISLLIVALGLILLLFKKILGKNRD